MKSEVVKILARRKDVVSLLQIVTECENSRDAKMIQVLEQDLPSYVCGRTIAPNPPEQEHWMVVTYHREEMPHDLPDGLLFAFLPMPSPAQSASAEQPAQRKRRKQDAESTGE